MLKTLSETRIIYVIAGTLIIPAVLLAVLVFGTLLYSEERIFEDSLPVTRDNSLYNHPLKSYIELSNDIYFNFFKNRNPLMNDNYLNEIIAIYKEECLTENINAAAAFCQMCHETNFLRYGGSVSAGQNNFAGIGAVSDSEKGTEFADTRTGIRAHIQHIKAYSTDEEPVNDTVDPRFTLVQRNSVQGIMDLSGKWASDPNYGKKILIYIMELYSYGSFTDTKN